MTNKGLIHKPGRRKTGRGAYIRKYLDHKLLAKFDAVCRKAKLTRSEMLSQVIEELIEKDRANEK